MTAAEAKASAALPEEVSRGGALQGMLRLPITKQLGLMVGLAASVALGLAAVLWSRTPGYSLLYGSLSPQGASEIMEALDQTGIAYRMDEKSGALMVPSESVHQARLKLAGQGLPRSSEMGFEILDKEQGFGTSQFVERARYQRALEVELSRSIATVKSVDAARVHLALPKQSVFVRNRKSPSASVLLNLHAGRRLTPGQVDAITYLVAASVPNMEADDVQVVDQRGQLLTHPEQDSQAHLNRTQLEYRRALEQDYVKRIEGILAPLLGPDGVRAQVTAEVDFTRREETREAFDPQQPAVRSEQLLDERGSGLIAAGIPGALSNQPPGAATAPEEAVAPGTTQEGKNVAPSRSRQTRNFELNRTISHAQLPMASLKRLSVAVVVDDHRSIGEDGAVVRASLTDEELARITGLVRQAVGFDETRGDQLTINNVSFAKPLLEAPESADAPVWEQQWVWDVGKQVAGILVLLSLVLGVLRPAMRRLTAGQVMVSEDTARLENQSEAGQAVTGQHRKDGEGGKGLADDQVSLSGASPLVPQLAGGSDLDSELQVARSVVEQDPQRVARLLLNWVSDDG